MLADITPRTGQNARRRLRFALLVAALVSASQAGAFADGTIAVRSGEVHDRSSGTPIARATIRLLRSDGSIAASTISKPDGTFVLSVDAGDGERLDARAIGYRRSFLQVSAEGRVHIALDAETPRSIVRTVTRPRDVIASAAVTTTAAGLEAFGALRVSDQLAKISGVTFSGDGLAPGGDAYLSLRGLRPSEGQALLNGHPIGPIGAAPEPPDADGTIAGFNYQDAPSFALRSTTVTFGSSAAPAFGVAGIGGAIDSNTLAPTSDSEASLEQAIGSEGRMSTALRATGTSGAFGYAFAYGVSGTYGLFPNGTVAQTGLRGTDLTTATLTSLTYAVSGDYVTRGGLFALVFTPRPSISLGLTAYDATSWSDKTGEGDNDFNPYAYTFANAPVGAAVSCPNGVSVRTDTGASCISAARYARAASGPAGGGPGATQALVNRDYDAGLRATAGRIRLAVDAYTDGYAFDYDREASAIGGPADAFFDRWRTRGLMAGAELQAKKNVVHGDVAVLTQILDGNASGFDDATVQPLPSQARTIRSTGVSDTYAPNARLAFAARAFASSSGDRTSLDPYARVTYHLTSRDTVAFSAGRTTEDPSLDVDRVRLLPIGALNPDCGAIAAASAASPAFVDVGTGPASNLHAERASDLELDADHAFGDNSRLKLSLYDANVSGRIVTAQILAGDQLPAAAVAPLEARIASFCGSSPAPGSVGFTLSRSFNVASAQLRGVEIAGRTRVARRVTLDYAYDLQTVTLGGIPAAVLQTDPTLVNGAQAYDVPRTKASLGAAITTPGGFRFELDGHAVGANNPQQLPAYAYADASLAQSAGAHADIDVEIGNLFNSHAQRYGLVGLGVPYATNSYFAAQASPFVQASNERFGLPPASITASATLHL